MLAVAALVALQHLHTYAEQYDTRLRDFICTRTTSRFDGSGKALDTVVQELTYVSHAEHYRTLKTSGNAADAPVVHGEFSSLPHIFDPRGKAEFTFDHAEGPTCTARYTAGLNSGVALRYGKAGSEQYLAHHGVITFDCETGVVSRLEMQTDKTGDGLQTAIEYGPVTIAGQQFTLPLHATDTTRHGRKVTRAEVTFTNYRKYGAESAIHFDGDN